MRMKFGFFVVALLLAQMSWAQYAVTVDVKGLRNTKGTLYFTLFRSETGFPDKAEKAFKRGKLETLKSSTASYIFNNIPAGTYAVSLLHDEDGDGDMKTNTLGIPLEGSGASNDARGRFGPPKFADAKFTVSADKRISITMWYF